MTIEDLNDAPEESARGALLSCCGSERWAAQMLSRRPFASAKELHRHAEEIWFALSPNDWLAAFSKHPKIGEASASKWSAQEQEGMSQAEPETADAIRDLNVQYEDRFGYLFLVCAAGKSASEMMTSMEQRLTNHPDEELRTAAAEQAKIMHLRLDKLLAAA